MKIGIDNCRKCIHSSVCTWYGAEYCDWYVNTCGDAISRQAAISAIEALQLPIMREASTCYQFKFSGMSEAKEAVENLPSVTPQQRTGRWIADVDKWGEIVTTVNGFRCSECNTFNTDKDNYCPNCGAKMEVEDADSN